MKTIFSITGRAFNYYSEIEKPWQKVSYVVYLLAATFFLILADLFRFAIMGFQKEESPDVEVEAKSFGELKKRLKRGKIKPKTVQKIAFDAVDKRHFTIIGLLTDHPKIWDRGNLIAFLKVAAKKNSLKTFQTVYAKEKLWKISRPGDLYEISIECKRGKTLNWLLTRGRKQILIEASERGNVDFLKGLTLSKEEMELVAYKASLAGQVDTINWAICKDVSLYFVLNPAIEKDRMEVIRLIFGKMKFSMLQTVQIAISRKALKILYFLYTQNVFDLFKDSECKQLLTLFPKRASTTTPTVDAKNNLQRFIYGLAVKSGEKSIVEDLSSEGVTAFSCLSRKFHS